ncbi:hemolysin family protein [Citricoccus nitrophenolicus]|uniref:Putative hemolysin n=1 Tax=Citricoccus muralis TaxID=169134 RepID=A0A3D9LJ62_9MICC|nr:hemolysin family protein [Citricoccus muralis]REE05093.1 putative hemolysin [Citricoccus muralis]
MDLNTLLNVALVVLFVLIGGVFAGTEMAIVNLRQSQVQAIEDSGPRGAKTAALVRDPNLFLSAVQIGVTVAGFFSSAYGASTIAPDLAPVLIGWGLGEQTASTAALIGMTLFIAYLSLVFGELVPKRMAMQNAVGFTKVLAPPLGAFAVLMRPAIWLLSVSTNLVVRLLGGDPKAHQEAVSAEEIRSMVSSSEALEDTDRHVLQSVFDAADRTVVEVMRPRPEVNFLAGDISVSEAMRQLADLPNSRYPITGEDSDDILGFIHIRDLLRVPDPSTTLAGIAREITVLPGTVDVLHALSRMRSSGNQIALVIDEYGGTDGIVTLEDLLEELVGDIYDEFDDSLAAEDNSLEQGEDAEVDGGLILQELAQQTGVELPDDGSYETVGGFVMAQLGRVPEAGDRVEAEGAGLEVVDMDGHRVGRVRITRTPDRPGE